VPPFDERPDSYGAGIVGGGHLLTPEREPLATYPPSLSVCSDVCVYVCVCIVLRTRITEEPRRGKPG
jgi:hypothetical protein